MLKNKRSCDDNLLDKNQLNQIYTFASMMQSTTPTINRVNMTELTNFEYTKKWSTETDTSAPSLICNATEFWKKASQQKSPLSHKPKNKGGKV